MRQVALSPARTDLTLATLFLGMFVLGSAELLVVGVLNLIAADLRVSIPAVPRGQPGGAGSALAQSLPASAANVGIAFGSFAGGVAVGGFTVSTAMITGLVIAVLAIPVAWGTSLLGPQD